MIKKMLALASYALVTGIVLLFSSCQQEENLSQENDQEEEAVIEMTSNGEDELEDALELAARSEAAFSAGQGGRVDWSLCATVTWNKETHQIIIDFGDGCVGPRGRIHRGKIIVTYSVASADHFADKVITFENYFVNDTQVTGAIEVRDIRVNSEENMQCSVRLVDLRIIFPNGRDITFNGKRIREWLAGFGDDEPSNNIFRITGSLEGVTSSGRLITQEITEPVISDWSCASSGFFARVSGKIEITRLSGFGVRKRIIFYGDGACDNVILIITVRRIYELAL